MSRQNDENNDCVDREQLETVLQFLEETHGESLRRPWSDEAHAYYQAIEIVEDAMDGELRSRDDIHLTDRDVKNIERSREARSEGYAAATLLDERFDSGGSPNRTLLSKLHRIWNRLISSV